MSERKTLLVAMGVVVLALAAALAGPLGAAVGALSLVLPWSTETSLTEPGEPLVVVTEVGPGPGNANLEDAEGQPLSPEGGEPIDATSNTGASMEDEVSGHVRCRRQQETGDGRAVSISPTSGPSGTLVEVVGCEFPGETEVSVGLGPVNSQFSEAARGTTDAEGFFSVEVPVEGAAGMTMVFALAAEGQPGVTSPDLFQITE